MRILTGLSWSLSTWVSTSTTFRWVTSSYVVTWEITHVIFLKVEKIVLQKGQYCEWSCFVPPRTGDDE